MKVLVTLGATEEPIDPIRFITNSSSGIMGRAVVLEALKRKHEVTVIAATTRIPLDELEGRVKLINVRTAKELIVESIEELKQGYDIFISAAAIADYTPENYSEKKIKSIDQDLIIKLKPLPKLTKMVKDKFKKVYVVAFKAEYNVSHSDLMTASYTKLRDENLNLVVGNDVHKNEMGSPKSEITMINWRGEFISVPKKRKEEISEKIWDIIEEEFSSPQKSSKD